MKITDNEVKNKKMPQITASIPQTFVDWIENVVQLEIYTSKSEIVRLALKDFIAKESTFIQNLNFDLSKLQDISRKYVEFKEHLNEKLLTGKKDSTISNAKFIN